MKILGMGWLELLIILAVVLIIFGPKNLPKLGNAIGKGIKSLRKGMSDADAEKEAAEAAAKAEAEAAAAAAAAAAAPAPAPAPAETVVVEDAPAPKTVKRVVKKAADTPAAE